MDIFDKKPDLSETIAKKEFEPVVMPKEDIPAAPAIEKVSRIKTEPLEVRPVPKNNPWHGKVGQESFTRPKGFKANVDKASMTYKVNLTHEQLKEMGEEMQLDLSLNHDPRVPHPFFDSNRGRIKLENHTMFFERQTTLGKLRVAIIQASEQVADSLEAFEKGLFPDATHYIVDNEAEAESKVASYEMKEEAIILASKVTYERKRQIVLILKGIDLAKKSDLLVKAKFSELIEEDAETVLRYLQKDPLRTDTEALVEKGILYSKLTKAAGGAVFHGDERLGFSVEAAVDFLILDENQELRIRLKEAIG